MNGFDTGLGAKDLAQHYSWRVVKKLILAGDLARRDALAMQALQPLSNAYVPWSTMAMRPTGLLAVLNDILIHRRRNILECGAGVSTLYIARLLQQHGGHLWTVEDNPEWADLLVDLLAAEALSSTATVILAPQEATSPGGEYHSWYSRSVLDAALAAQKFDLLLVDGPNAYDRAVRYSRYPALPYFWASLAPGFTVVLDDINRLGERRVIARWEAEYSIDFERRLVDGSVAFGRLRRSHLTPMAPG